MLWAHYYLFFHAMMNPLTGGLSARVYFVAAPSDDPQGSRLLRLWLRRPARITRIAWQVAGTRTIKLLSGSPLTHLAVGVGDRVFVPTLSGGFVWTREVFEATYPRIVGFSDIPIFPIHRLDDDERPYRLLAFLAHWASRGWIDAHTCVGDVKAVLSAGGFAVPRRVVTPEQLRRHLIVRGCKYTLVGNPGPQDGGGAAQAP